MLIYNGIGLFIEHNHRCFGLGDYFMAAELVAAIYSRRFQYFLSCACTVCEGSRWKCVPPVTRNNTPLLEHYWELMSLMLSEFPENCILFDS